MHILCTYVMQVTEKLLEAEDRKLKVLKAEIEAGKHSDAAAASSSKVSHACEVLLSCFTGEDQGQKKFTMLVICWIFIYNLHC